MVTEDYKEAVQLQTSADAKPCLSEMSSDRRELPATGPYPKRRTVLLWGLSFAPREKAVPGGFDRKYRCVGCFTGPGPRDSKKSCIQRRMRFSSADGFGTDFCTGRIKHPSPEEEELTETSACRIYLPFRVYISVFIRLASGRLGPLTGKYAARILALLLVAFYIYLIGFPVSAVRAFIMALVLVLARSLRASYDPLTALFFAASVILLLFPGSVVDAGFHLSFAGVWSVVWVRKVFLQKMGREHSLLLSSLAIQMGILPALLLHFWRAPLAGLLANLLLIPLFSFFVGAGAFAIGLYFVFVPLTSLLAGVAQTAGTAFFTLSDSIGSLTIPVLQFFWVGPVTVAWIYLLFYLYLRPQTLDRMPYAWKAVFCSVLSTFGRYALGAKKKSRSSLSISGRRCWIQTGTRAYLIDTGGEIRDDQPTAWSVFYRLLWPEKGASYQRSFCQPF